MRLGIVSDIHCNSEGLLGALDRLGEVDELVCAGDLIYAYRYEREVISILRQRGARVILGNHELGFMSSGLAEREADAEGVDFLRRQPLYLDVEVSGKRLVVVHASPFEREHRFLYGPDFALEGIAELEADYLIVGHTHVQGEQRLGRTLLINPGSTGETRSLRGEVVLACAVLDTASGEVTFENFADPRSGR